jgi:hypothetical protein
VASIAPNSPTRATNQTRNTQEVSRIYVAQNNVFACFKVQMFSHYFFALNERASPCFPNSYTLKVFHQLKGTISKEYTTHIIKRGHTFHRWQWERPSYDTFLLHDHYNEHGIKKFSVACVKSKKTLAHRLGVNAIEDVLRLEFQKYHNSTHCSANVFLIFVMDETIKRKKEKEWKKDMFGYTYACVKLEIINMDINML